jgi:hypothetical protein
MDKVFIYNELLGVKGAPGILHETTDKGYYITVMKIKDRRHRVLLPIESTVIIYSEPVIEMDNALALEE